MGYNLNNGKFHGLGIKEWDLMMVWICARPCSPAKFSIKKFSENSNCQGSQTSQFWYFRYMFTISESLSYSPWYIYIFFQKRLSHDSSCKGPIVIQPRQSMSIEAFCWNCAITIYKMLVITNEAKDLQLVSSCSWEILCSQSKWQRTSSKFAPGWILEPLKGIVV